MVCDQPIANRISFNSAEHDDLIEAVTVFQSKRAEVKRRVNVDLKASQNHVRIERLPSVVNEDSIRVDGTGNATIFDVVYHAPSHNRNPSSSATTDLRRTLEILEKERSIAREQSEFLGNYVARRIQELDGLIKKTHDEIDKTEIKRLEDIRMQRGTAITVTVLAEVDGPIELMLTYVVSDASWKPLYDIRASISKTPEGTSTIALHYRASITQTTGENWPDVALTLSTAFPLLGSSVPKLSPWRIGPPAPERFDAMMINTSSGWGTRDLSSAAPPPRMAVRRARVESAGVLNTTFGILGRSDIPSDNGSHKVIIAVLDLQADLEWTCVPREKEFVFLNCQVVNSSEFTLLPGEASVFVDDNFVSKSRIEHVSPNESFKTSLGVDSALRVTYPPAKTLNRTAAQSGFLFMFKGQSVFAQSQRITIRNTRPAPVSVRVLDHVPVSTDAQLKVNLLLPNGLDTVIAPDEGEGGRKELPWKELQEGVKARWAPLETGGEGTVEWSCNIGPSDEVELELAWEASAPTGLTWENI